MSNSSDIDKLIVAAQKYSTYSTFIISGFGFIGSLLNILVFTNLKIFRRNRCAFYLIIESFVDIGQLTHIFINEIWKLLINEVEPMNISIVWCKLKNTFPQWCRFMLSLIVCFAAIDQFLSTNYMAYLRQLSSLKVARRQVCFATVICLLHTIPFAILLQISPSLGCIITNTMLKDYYSFFYYTVLNGLLPIFVASLFSILAYRNVRRIVRRQIPIDRRRLDQQLTAMIFVRVIAFVIFTIPYTTYRIYSLNVTISRTDLYSYAVTQLVYLIIVSLVFVNHGSSFYIFLATSGRFRGQVKYFLVRKCCQSLKRWCRGHSNAVQVLNEASIESGIELK